MFDYCFVIIVNKNNFLLFIYKILKLDEFSIYFIK
jgi:hypothetical protein